MALTTSAYIGIASIVAGAVGTGVSYYSQSQAAASARSIADYNAKLSRQNAANNLGIQQAQALGEQRQLEAAAAAQQQNARTIRTTADDQAAAGREDIRAKRVEGARLMAIQRARIAKSGIVESGTPLDILADTAAEIQHGAELDLYEQNQARDQAYRAAAFEDAGAGATLLNADSAKLKGTAAYAGYRNQLSQINLQRLTGQQQASAAQTAATGTLLQGIGSTAYQGYQMKQNAPKAK